jgi:type III restriction enzyme
MKGTGETGDEFFESPILNSPYEEPGRYWELDEGGRPTGRILDGRRQAAYITPIARAKRDAGTASAQGELDLGIKAGNDDQRYDQYALINEVRYEVSKWRSLPEANWGVTPETARLLKHWRSYKFQNQRPFFCQIEAAEIYIWLTEVAPKTKVGERILAYIANGNEDANPGIERIALKLATGAGKTTVMAMIIAWQTINAVRSPSSRKFTNAFLVVSPGLTIRDRLRVLRPSDPDEYYLHREIIPQEFAHDIKKAKIVITNYHAFKPRELLEVAKGTRALLEGRHARDEFVTTESPGQVLQRVMKELMGSKRILIINDEAHHCYREKPMTEEERKAKLEREEKDEIAERKEMARVWISGLESVSKTMSARVLDLSATPFFLRGSGYAESTLFPWTVSDFSLMDAIECGIVKLPRVPVSDNSARLTRDNLPVFRNLWENVRSAMPKKARANSKDALDPMELPPMVMSAIDELYGNYEKVSKAWEEAKMPVPPCFIFVCQNTAISKLIYDYVSGYRFGPQEEFHPAHCPLFRNFDDNGEPIARPNTILVDSVQLESGEGLSPDFAKAAQEEIEQYKRELTERYGSRRKADEIDDSDILREVMNTVGKEGRLGGNIRCVVSVSMLTEGWDANNVTHILGLRAFGTQLICEQVVGRALRRSSYELGEDGRFAPEYADIFGIPFNFASKGVPVTINPPPPVHTVKALTPERDGAEIRFPNVSGYRLELPNEKLTAKWEETSDIVLTPDIVGPCKTRNEGIVGEGEDLSLAHLKNVRTNTIVYVLTKYLLQYHLRERGEEVPIHLFGQAKHIVEDWVKNHFRCSGAAYPAQILYASLAQDACRRIMAGITRQAETKTNVVKAALNPYNPDGSTRYVRFVTTKRGLWKTNAKCHINWAVLDSDWEGEFCRVLEACGRVKSYVKNDHLGFVVPYMRGMDRHEYYPDFIVRLDSGVNLVLEVKGFAGEDVRQKREAMETQWVPGVNRLGSFGRWAFAQFDDANEMEKKFNDFIQQF